MTAVSSGVAMVWHVQSTQPCGTLGTGSVLGVIWSLGAGIDAGMLPLVRNGPRCRRRTIGRRRGSYPESTALESLVQPTEERGSELVHRAGDVVATLPSFGSGFQMGRGLWYPRMLWDGAAGALVEPAMGPYISKGLSPMMLPPCSMTAAALESPGSEAFRCP